MTDELYKACCDFKQAYLKPPTEMLMHPSVWDDLCMSNNRNLVSMFTVPESRVALFGITIKEDTRLPVGLVRFTNGRQVGQLWLSGYSKQ